MKKLYMLPILALALSACESRDNVAPKAPQKVPVQTTTVNTTRDGNVEVNTTRAVNPDVLRNRDVDNSAINVRDRDSVVKTPMDQLENEADRTISQKIRQSLVRDDSLSANAKNIKVITINGVVTLRGPVASQNEKSDIERKVKAVQGVTRVDNQLDVTKSN